MEDSQILDLYWERNPEAISQTDQKYGAYCRQVSFQILRSREDSEECVNDTWLRAWNAMPPQRPGYLQAFLGKLTRNLSLDRWEHNRALKRGGGRTNLLLSELGDCIPAAGSLEQTMEDRAVSASISRWLRKQTSRNRVAFVRRYWYGDTLTQVAKRLGLSEGGTKSLLHRLRQSLKDHLEQEGIAL